jgi:hypothetical protein
MKIFRINTTAYEEEDFFLLTDLIEDDITEVIHPIVMAERDGYEDYDNETIISALRKRYPHNKIEMIDEIEQLTY